LGRANVQARASTSEDSCVRIVLISRCCVIAPIATAIRAGGQEGEAIRLTLDIYEEPGIMQRLMELRGQELIAVLRDIDWS